MGRTRNLSIRLSDKEYEQVAAAAEAQMRSMARWILVAIHRQLDAEQT